ncbi:MAG TPA: hypothetical protein PKH39_07585 [Woeseiaceae bacterium]|nr:hypothetical protein [Woeseiaceae bacterium]
MRSFIVITMFTASLAHAGWGSYEELRTLTLDGDDIAVLSIDAGAGSMDVTGVEGLGEVIVKATIVVDDGDKDDALQFIEKRMTLSLRESGKTAELKSYFDGGFMGLGKNARIDLDIRVPEGMAVSIVDSSGSIDVTGTMGDVSIDDGSGSIDVNHVANVKIDDGSGSIDIGNASGDVFVVDGSGSIGIRRVGGSVTIDDGSGSIRVSDIEKNLTIVDDGSGSVSISDVRGDVEQET